MSTVPLQADILEDGLLRPRNWEPRRNNLKIPLRLVRLCILGTILPAMLVAGPIYLRYIVYSEQLYPLSASDQRLIDGKVSTTWCQKQVVKVNATFNAYLMQEEPKVKGETIPVSMTRHLILEDDMKEYWGFYLLRGSSVTVSTCVRWPGASLTIIRGHKNLHECAFIGDDSSEELEELLEIAEERGHLNILNSTLQDDGPSNEPDKMKRARQEVLFHHKDSTPGVNNTLPRHVAHHYNSHELDAKAMRNILTQLFMKTLDTKKKQEEAPHHHYEGVFMDSANIEKPPVVGSDFPYTGDSLDSKEIITDKESTQPILDEKKARKQDALVEAKKSKHASREGSTNGTFEEDKMSLGKQLDRESLQESSQRINTDNKETLKYHSNDSTIGLDSITEKTIIELAQQGVNNSGLTSAEVFQDVLKKIRLLGERGKHVLERLVNEIDNKKNDEAMALRKMAKEVMKGNFSEEEIKRRKRDLILSSPLHDELTQDDSDRDAAIEEGYSRQTH
ncbi:uncharacterized protein LOC107269113 [Cephus cinctus]|uniref:Uncharacterized protein LOC107269113 n=1 Tax=Cephus cinctus TaxID=211228 RepID=A0AAJ7W2M6_CEPCN|nr:uncharacterized protein LOC107269113 [Cephus cinctus]